MGRIALCGVFDIPNYGDHLFPLVFRNELSQRGYDGDVVLFSPFAARKSFVENSQVFSLDDMERMHREQPFDAIVVGGGEIIHWHRFGQKLTFGSDDYTDYPMDKVWLVPCFMKMKYGVKLLWNAPGIPFDFEVSREIAHLVFDNVDYLSVRNAFSRRVLIDNGIEPQRITQVPDTGFSLRSIASGRELREAKDAVFPGVERYAVFHCNRFIPSDAIPGAVDTLTQLHERGYRIVLLPLAYTHGDENILQEVRSRLPFEALMARDPLSLIEIIGVLANCSVYVGTSLHGSVTASVFGRTIVGFDYQQTKKTRDLYDQLGYGRYYVTDSRRLCATTFEALESQSRFDFSGIQDKIDRHFDTMLEFVSGREPGHENALDQASAFSDLVQGFFTHKSHVEGLNARVRELDEALQTNIGLVRLFDAQRQSYAHDCEVLKRDYDALQTAVVNQPIQTYRALKNKLR